MNEEGYVNVADQLGLSGERGELSMFFSWYSLPQSQPSLIWPISRLFDIPPVLGKASAGTLLLK